MEDKTGGEFAGGDATPSTLTPVVVGGVKVSVSIELFALSLIVPALRARFGSRTIPLLSESPFATVYLKVRVFVPEPDT
jgi:hypothetical protein